MGPLQMESELPEIVAESPPEPDWIPRHDTLKGYRGGGSKHILLWQEDDAHPPDGEKLDAAWSRIFGDQTGSPRNSFDGGDAFYYLYGSNRVAVESPCGDAIYQYLPARKFD